MYEDGEFIKDYGCDIWSCGVADRIGVQRTGSGELWVHVNGEDLGIAARNVPGKVYAVVDVYAKCKQVSLVYSSEG